MIKLSPSFFIDDLYSVCQDIKYFTNLKFFGDKTIASHDKIISINNFSDILSYLEGIIILAKILIIGAGFCSSAVSKRKVQSRDITIIDKLPFTVQESELFYGGHPYTFGPRHFSERKRGFLLS